MCLQFKLFPKVISSTTVSQLEFYGFIVEKGQEERKIEIQK